MDAVVYPDKEMLEITKNFICIRIEHDQNPEIVKKYGVKGLPDVRLFNAQGKEIVKLLGFSSSSRLISQCKAVLENNTTKLQNITPKRSLKPTNENIIKAISDGISFLKAEHKKGWQASPGVDPSSAVLFAWTACKVKSNDPEFTKLLESILKADLYGTYEVCFQALALTKLDPKKYKDRLEECSSFLIKNQIENGQWTYSPVKNGPPPKIGDNSNTAFALLALAACKKAGIKVPASVIEKTEAFWRSCQNKDGGWGYRTDRETESYSSMTENGVSSIAICCRLLGRDVNKDESVKRGLEWIQKHFSVAENKKSVYQQGRLIYHLYALERVGALLDTEKMGENDWYYKGAEFLLSIQNDDGSWDDNADMPIPNTAISLLFLSHSTDLIK